MQFKYIADFECSDVVIGWCYSYVATSLFTPSRSQFGHSEVMVERYKKRNEYPSEATQSLGKFIKVCDACERRGFVYVRARCAWVVCGMCRDVCGVYAMCTCGCTTYFPASVCLPMHRMTICRLTKSLFLVLLVFCLWIVFPFQSLNLNPFLPYS